MSAAPQQFPAQPQPIPTGQLEPRLRTGNDLALDEREVARRLGVKVHTIRKWRFLGKGPRYFKYGKGAAE